MNITIQTVRLGELHTARADVNYEGLPAEGMGQAEVVVHLEGEDDTITIELGQMPDGASRAADLLRDLARELDGEAADYEDVPVIWDAFVGIDRHVWVASIEGKTIDLPEGLSEAGALVGLELACFDAGYFPAMWLDQGGRGYGHVLITREMLANAAAEVLDIGALEEPHCEHCSQPITTSDGQWTHPVVPHLYGHLSATGHPLCHVYNGWELEDGEEPLTATPEEVYPADAVRAILDEMSS